MSKHVPAFKKRTVAHFKYYIGGWIGWDKFKRDYESVQDWKAKSYMACLFALGCRVSEIRTLVPRQINTEYALDPNYVEIKQMYVEKQREWIQVIGEDGKPIIMPNGKNKLESNSIPDYRTFIIHKTEWTTGVLLDMAKWAIDIEIRKGTKNPEEQPIFTDSRFSIYYHLSKIRADEDKSKKWNENKGIYHPHMIRSLRASLLAGNYRYTIPQMMKFFGWKDENMPLEYASLTAENLIINPQYAPK